jgi:hypothetical protein
MALNAEPLFHCGNEVKSAGCNPGRNYNRFGILDMPVLQASGARAFNSRNQSTQNPSRRAVPGGVR